MSRLRYILFFVGLFIAIPHSCFAQLGFDHVSVMALVDDHKRIRSVLLARSSMEQANELLHQYSRTAAVDYDSLNVKLDKYTKCFDIIDIIYTSGMTVVNVRDTYKDVSDRIVKLKNLIETFVNECTLKGNILSSDTIIIGACRRAVSQVGNDGQDLIYSLVELAQYASGLRHMTTAELFLVLGNINSSLDNIRTTIDHAYYVIWKYVTMRTHFFKRELYQAKTLGELCNDAFSRWRRVTREVGY